MSTWQDPIKSSAPHNQSNKCAYGVRAHAVVPFRVSVAKVEAATSTTDKCPCAAGRRAKVFLCPCTGTPVGLRQRFSHLQMDKYCRPCGLVKWSGVTCVRFGWPAGRHVKVLKAVCVWAAANCGLKGYMGKFWQSGSVLRQLIINPPLHFSLPTSPLTWY